MADRSGIAETAGRAASYPLKFAARAWRGGLESAADDVAASPEVARLLDRVLAGPLPEELAASLVRHRVLERIGTRLAASGELERLIGKTLESAETRQLVDRVLASSATHEALERITSSPEVRRALARQSAGLADDVVAGVRNAALRLDRRAGRPAQPAFAGVGTRAVALAIDALLALLIYASASAVVALIASLVGGIRPHWLAGTILSAGATLVAGVYFVLFWSAAGQTPGMRLMRLRVRRADGGGISAVRAGVRAIGLALAIIPFFLGFVPALFDGRRRALPDYLAGTVVLYDESA
jgi:uncharacterized RDD family membrane protein YckC